MSYNLEFFFHQQRPMSWQGIQQYQQLNHLDARAAVDLEFQLEASKAKQVGVFQIRFYNFLITCMTSTFYS